MNLNNNIIVPMKTSLIRFQRQSTVILRKSPKRSNVIRSSNKNIMAKYQQSLKSIINPSQFQKRILKSAAKSTKSTFRYRKAQSNQNQQNQQNLRKIMNNQTSNQNKNSALCKSKTEQIESVMRRSLVKSPNRKYRQKINTMNSKVQLTKSCKLNNNYENQQIPQNIRSNTTTSHFRNQPSSRKTQKNVFLICKKLKSQAKQVYYNQCLSSLLIERQINLRLNDQNEQEIFQNLIKKIKTNQESQINSSIQIDTNSLIVFNNFSRTLQNDSKNRQNSNQNYQLNSHMFTSSIINPQKQIVNSFSQYRQKAKNNVFKSALQWSQKRINTMKNSRYKTLKQDLNRKKQNLDIQIDRWSGNNDIEDIHLHKYQK